MKCIQVLPKLHSSTLSLPLLLCMHFWKWEQCGVHDIYFYTENGTKHQKLCQHSWNGIGQLLSNGITLLVAHYNVGFLSRQAFKNIFPSHKSQLMQHGWKTVISHDAFLSWQICVGGFHYRVERWCALQVKNSPESVSTGKLVGPVKICLKLLLKSQ